MKNKEKNLIIILGILCLTLVVIAVVIVAKFYQNKTESKKQAESIKEQVSEITTDNATNTTNTTKSINTNTTTTNTTNSNTTSTNTNTTFQNTTKENTTTSSDTTSSSSNAITSSETEDSEIIGKWNTQKVSDLKANETYDNLKDLYGSSYLEFGSYLQLNDDGTFVDAIQPVTNGSTSAEGKYKILRSYNKLGDCYVELTYSDGRTEMLQRVYYDNTETPYLTFNSGDLSYILKK